MTTKSRLYAILFADIEGYTSQMQKDETATLQKLARCQSVIQKEVQVRQGEVVKNYGDGSICLLPSASGAIDCAIAVQIALKEEPKVALRIGLHLGDVTFKDSDVYGDAINIASRIESMSVPGAILVSNALYDRIKNRNEYKVNPLGSFHFKNVAEPIQVYAVANEGIVVPDKSNLHGKLEPQKFTTSKMWIVASALLIFTLTGVFIIQNRISTEDKSSPLSPTSVAILPFIDLSPNQDQKQIADGLPANIINLLSRIQPLIVIGRRSSFAFRDSKLDARQIADSLNVSNIVEGSILLSDNQLIIGIELINGKSGEIIWSDDIPYDYDAIFDVQTDVAKRICNELQVSITKENLEQILNDDSKLTLLRLKADEMLFADDTRKNVGEYVNLWKQSLKYDSALSTFASLADVTYWDYRTGVTSDRDSTISELRKYLDDMMAIDSTSAYTFWIRALLAQIEFDFSANYRYLKSSTEAIDVDPLTICVCGFHMGDKRGIELCEKALEEDPLWRWTYNNLGYLYLWNGEYDNSIRMFEKFRILTSRKSHDALALANALKGEYNIAIDHTELLQDEESRLFFQAVIYALMRDRNAFNQTYSSYVRIAGNKSIFPFNDAILHSLVNENDLAFQNLEKAIEQRNIELVTLPYNPLLANLHEDPRWNIILKKVGLLD